MSVMVDPVSPQKCMIQLLAMLVGAYTLFRILLSWAAAKRFTPLRSGAVLLTGTECARAFWGAKTMQCLNQDIAMSLPVHGMGVLMQERGMTIG
jgi:hypothetical protein